MSGGHSPSLRELDQLPDVATIWYRLGLQLEVGANDLDMIEKNYPQDADMRKIKMFAEWQRRDTNPTYEKLVRALVALGKRKLAESVCCVQGILPSVLDTVDAFKTHQSHDPTPTAAATGGKEEDTFRHHRAAKPSRLCVNDGSDSSRSSESGLGTSLSEGEPLDSPDFGLRHRCGCKQCTLHKFCDVGCPEPDKHAVVPVLSENTSADASLHQFHLEGQRQHETQQMMTSFASLVNKTLKSIKKKVPATEFIVWLKQLEAVKKVSLRSESTPGLLAQQMNEISQAGSMEQVFLILSDYWSWYNHSLVEEMINEYGDKEDQSRLDDFKKKFSTFAHNRIVEFSQHPMIFGAAAGDRKIRIPLLFKVDRNWDTVHINQLSEIHRNLASILGVNPHALYLASIRKGCILMKFLVSSSVAQAVFPLSASQKEALAATDITLVKCGGHCHRFLPHSRPQENVADSPPENDAATTMMRIQYWSDVTPPESTLDSECDEGSLEDFTSDDNAADSISEQLSSNDNFSDSEEKGSGEGFLELVMGTLNHQQIPQTPAAIETSGTPECEEGSLKDLTSDDNAADSRSEQLSSNDNSSDSEKKGSEESKPQAEASLVAEAGTLDCTAGQASLGSGCKREHSSLQEDECLHGTRKEPPVMPNELLFSGGALSVANFTMCTKEPEFDNLRICQKMKGCSDIVPYLFTASQELAEPEWRKMLGSGPYGIVCQLSLGSGSAGSMAMSDDEDEAIYSALRDIEQNSTADSKTLAAYLFKAVGVTDRDFAECYFSLKDSNDHHSYAWPLTCRILRQAGCAGVFKLDQVAKLLQGDTLPTLPKLALRELVAVVAPQIAAESKNATAKKFVQHVCRISLKMNPDHFGFDLEGVVNLFETAENKCLISPTNVTPLCSWLEHVDRQDLASKVLEQSHTLPGQQPITDHLKGSPIDTPPQGQGEAAFQTSHGIEVYRLNGVQLTEEELGQGSYTVVLRLEYRGLKCAGKQLYPVLYEQGVGDTVRRFEEECRLLAQMRHPHIVQFLGVFVEEGSRVPILVMESLPTTLTRGINTYSVLPEEVSYSILHDVALGLYYLHSQTPPIVHRDLSANNVLLASNMTAKISDLGVAKILSRMTHAPGTSAYMPPEVMRVNPRYDARIDKFSYGVLMIHALSGRWLMPVCEAAHPDPRNPDRFIPVSEADRREEYLRDIGNIHPLMDLIIRCVSNNPVRRARAAEIVQQLAGMVSQFPLSIAGRVEMPQGIQTETFEKLRAEIQRFVAEAEQHQAEVEQVRTEVTAEPNAQYTAAQTRLKGEIQILEQLDQHRLEEIKRSELAHSIEIEETHLQLAQTEALQSELESQNETFQSRLRSENEIHKVELTAQIEAREQETRALRRELQSLETELTRVRRVNRNLQTTVASMDKAIQSKEREILSKRAELLANQEETAKMVFERERLQAVVLSRDREIELKQQEVHVNKREVSAKNELIAAMSTEISIKEATVVEDATLAKKESELVSRNAVLEHQSSTIQGLREQLTRAREFLSGQKPQPHPLHPQAKITREPCRDLPVRMDVAQTVVIGDRVYCGGGYATDDNKYQISCSSPSEDTWNTLPACDVRYFGLVQVRGKLVTVGEKLVTVGGTKKSGGRLKVTNEVYNLDEVTHSWKQSIPPIPTARLSPAVLSYNSALIVAGGNTGTVYGTRTSVVEVFREETSQWYTTEPLPFCWLNPSSLRINNSAWEVLPNTPHYTPATATFGASLLAVGGTATNKHPLSQQTEVYIYCSSTNAWIHISDLPAPRQWAATAILSPAQFLVIGGWNNGRQNSVYKGFLRIE